MTTKKDSIPGGYILVARKLRSNSIMQGPPMYIKLFMWMLLTAYFKGGKGLVRGQFLTSISELRNAMAYRIGYRAVKPTVDQIRSAYEAFTKASMITTTKTSNGMIITILNYDKYQNPENYEAHNEHHNENLTEPGVTPHPYIKRRVKEGEVDPETILSLRERYSDQNIINKVFKAIGSTRRSGKVADSVILAQLTKWSSYPITQVEAGIRIYLEKDYASQGKRENYLLGIIRSQPSAQPIHCLREAEKPKEISLDELYAN